VIIKAKPPALIPALSTPPMVENPPIGEKYPEIIHNNSMVIAKYCHQLHSQNLNKNK